MVCYVEDQGRKLSSKGRRGVDSYVVNGREFKDLDSSTGGLK